MGTSDQNAAKVAALDQIIAIIGEYLPPNSLCAANFCSKPNIRANPPIAFPIQRRPTLSSRNAARVWRCLRTGSGRCDEESAGECRYESDTNARAEIIGSGHRRIREMGPIVDGYPGKPVVSNVCSDETGYRLACIRRTTNETISIWRANPMVPRHLDRTSFLKSPLCQPRYDEQSQAIALTRS